MRLLLSKYCDIDNFLVLRYFARNSLVVLLSPNKGMAEIWMKYMHNESFKV